MGGRARRLDRGGAKKGRQIPARPGLLRSRHLGGRGAGSGHRNAPQSDEGGRIESCFYIIGVSVGGRYSYISSGAGAGKGQREQFIERLKGFSIGPQRKVR